MGKGVRIRGREVEEDIFRAGDMTGNHNYVWVPDDLDSTRPVIAVVVSLSVAIFAVVTLIASYMLKEMLAQRRNVRTVKIRPFVS